MDILLRVAVRAGAGEPQFSLHRKLVAGKAVQPLVLSVENEGGAAVVIKVPLLPAARVVTLLALNAEPLLVLVVLAVARVAIGLGVLELRRGVAVLAGDFRVLAEQRKARQAVVEPGLLPARLVVARLALWAELPFVLVVLAVTGDAGRRELLLVDEPLVAADAGDLGVLGAEGKYISWRA